MTSTRVLLATTGAGIARAEGSADGEWKLDIVLTGHVTRCLAADPLYPTIVYAGTQGRGALRSVDGGRTWRPAGLDGHVVKSLALSRAEPHVVYAGTKPAQVF